MPGKSGIQKTATLAGLLLVAVAAFSGGAAAKANNLAAERQALFARMLREPDNLDVAFSYAALSVKAGDLEGAVSTLERMLIFAPGLARLQMELGVLYYRLGSFDTSQAYFKAALVGINTPSVVKIRVEEYLALIEKRLKRFRWSSKSFFGLRWQSNANSGPSFATVFAGGLPVVAAKKSDFGVVVSNRIHFEYDLESQGDRLELDYVDFATVQFEQSRVNSAVSEVTFGPAINLGRFEIDDSFASIYAIANGALLAEKLYFGTLGVGTRLVSQPNRRTQFTLKGEFRHQWFKNTTQRPMASMRNGNEFRGIGQVSYRLSPNLYGKANTRVSRKDRRAGFLDYWEFGGGVQLDWLFDPVKMSGDLPWRLTSSAGYLHRNYDAPNLAAGATIKQNDNEYWAGSVLRVPFNKNWAFMPKAEYRQVVSNNPLRSYKAFTATIGVEYRQ